MVRKKIVSRISLPASTISCEIRGIMTQRCMYGISYLNAAYLVHNYMSSNCCHNQYQHNNSNNTTCNTSNKTSNNLICSEQNFYS